MSFNLMSVLAHTALSWTWRVYVHMWCLFSSRQISHVSQTGTKFTINVTFQTSDPSASNLPIIDYRHAPSYPVYAALCITLLASHVLGKHSTLDIYFKFSICNQCLNDWVMVMWVKESLSESFILYNDRCLLPAHFSFSQMLKLYSLGAN